MIRQADIRIADHAGISRVMESLHKRRQLKKNQVPSHLIRTQDSTQLEPLEHRVMFDGALSYYLAGDTNHDGLVNGQDIYGFISAIIQPSGIPTPAADVNSDQLLNGQDANSFILALSGHYNVIHVVHDTTSSIISAQNFLQAYEAAKRVPRADGVRVTVEIEPGEYRFASGTMIMFDQEGFDFTAYRFNPAAPNAEPWWAPLSVNVDPPDIAHAGLNYTAPVVFITDGGSSDPTNTSNVGLNYQQLYVSPAQGGKIPQAGRPLGYQTADNINFTGISFINNGYGYGYWGNNQDDPEYDDSGFIIAVKGGNSRSSYNYCSFWANFFSEFSRARHGRLSVTSKGGADYPLMGTWRHCFGGESGWRVFTTATDWGQSPDVAPGTACNMKAYNCISTGSGFGGDTYNSWIDGYYENCINHGVAGFGGCCAGGLPIVSTCTIVGGWSRDNSYAMGRECAGTFIGVTGYGKNHFGGSGTAAGYLKYQGRFSGVAIDCVSEGGSSFGAGGLGQVEYFSIFDDYTTGGLTGRLQNCQNLAQDAPLRLDGGIIDGCVFKATSANVDLIVPTDRGGMIVNSTLIVKEGGKVISNHRDEFFAVGNSRFNTFGSAPTGSGTYFQARPLPSFIPGSFSGQATFWDNQTRNFTVLADGTFAAVGNWRETSGSMTFRLSGGLDLDSPAGDWSVAFNAPLKAGYGLRLTFDQAYDPANARITMSGNTLVGPQAAANWKNWAIVNWANTYGDGSVASGSNFITDGGNTVTSLDPTI